MKRFFPFLLVLLPLACGEPRPEPGTDENTMALTLQAALGGEAGAGFLRADAPREFSFPRDHGLHPGFRNEWWYLTGNLATAEGRRFGYQFTLFSIAVRPPARPPPGEPESAWDSERIWMGHFALSDVQGRQHYAFERFSRGNPGLAGVETGPFRLWLDDWRLDASGEEAAFPWRLELAAGPVALSLRLETLKAPVLQGDAGLSRKSASPGNASYYYSMTRMPADGEIRIGDRRFAVEGLSWLDREWSTSALDENQSGWDWFSLQFDDGRELMYYRLRDEKGETHPFSAGNWTTRYGGQVPVAPGELRLRELERWNSPGGVEYTTGWRLDYLGRSWRVRALLEDQWMDLSLPYWEGAVEVLDWDSGEIVGRGYLEMAR